MSVAVLRGIRLACRELYQEGCGRLLVPKSQTEAASARVGAFTVRLIGCVTASFARRKTSTSSRTKRRHAKESTSSMNRSGRAKSYPSKRPLEGLTRFSGALSLRESWSFLLLRFSGRKCRETWHPRERRRPGLTRSVKFDDHPALRFSPKKERHGNVWLMHLALNLVFLVLRRGACLNREEPHHHLLPEAHRREVC